MTWHSALWLSLAIFVVGAESAFGNEDAVRDGSHTLQMTVYFAELKPVEGVTESKGLKIGEGGGQLVYLHKKPALVATPETVQNFTVSSHDFSDISPGQINYQIILHFTPKARKVLAETLNGKGEQMRLVTVFIGRKRFGMQRYEVTNTGPEMCRADTFSLLFSPPSKSETLRIVNTLLRNTPRSPK